MEYDSKTRLFFLNSINAETITAITEQFGGIIDTQGFQSLTFYQIITSFTGNANVTFVLEDSPNANLSPATGVFDADDPKTLVGILPFTQSGTGIKSVGYIGKKRYVRPKLSISGVSGLSLMIQVVSVLSNPTKSPTKDQ